MLLISVVFVVHLYQSVINLRVALSVYRSRLRCAPPILLLLQDSHVALLHQDCVISRILVTALEFVWQMFSPPLISVVPPHRFVICLRRVPDHRPIARPIRLLPLILCVVIPLRAFVIFRTLVMEPAFVSIVISPLRKYVGLPLVVVTSLRLVPGHQ
jgi:hypothetical protein